MKNNNDNFLLFLSFSIAIHLVVIYFFIFGLPYSFKEQSEEVIYFEMLPISDISNIKNQQKSKEKEVENEIAKKVQNTKSDPVEEKKEIDIKPEEKPIEKKEVPEEDNKKEIVDKEKEIITIKKKEEPKKKEVAPKPKEEIKKIDAKDNKKPKDKKQKKQNNSELDSLLKTLEQSSEGTDTKSAKHSRAMHNDTQESKGNYDENLPLSITEMNLIKKQIENNWNPPLGAKDISKIRVTLLIILDKDGSLLDVQLVDKVCPFGVSVASCNALVNSAIIAVKKASPIANLNPVRYSIWKTFNFDFDPSKLSR